MKIIVIAAMVDVVALSLYKEDGSIVTIEQGDPRLQPALDICLAGLKKEGDKVEIDLSEANHFADYEKKSGGLVKLFRVAKSKVAEFFGKTEQAPAAPVKPIVLGKVPGRGTPTVTAVVTKKLPTEEQKDANLKSAVAEIISQAVPVTSENFTAPEKPELAGKYQTKADDNEGETIIAVTNGRVIPGVEQLKGQMAHASQHNAVGLNAFMERISKVIGERRHSVEDLLKFLEKGDLPLSDDGCVIAYKRLNRVSDKPGTFVDVHSKRVFQKVGSLVHMDVQMVDHNRAQDCSHGLHIARRGYLKSFSGDVTVICKIRPEDIIAVPQYDANKVRVCAYHIIAELTYEQARKVCTNLSMTDDEETKLLLGKLLAGDHTGITQFVKIGGHNGTNLTITEAEQAVGVPEAAAEAYVEKAKKAPRKAESIDEGKVTAPAVDVKAVATAVAVAKDKVKGVHKPTLKEQAQSFVDDVISLRTDVATKEVAATELVKLKKASKKSWDALGITPAMVDTVHKLAAVPAKGAIFTSPETLAKAEAKVAKQPAPKADFEVGRKPARTVVSQTPSYKTKPPATTRVVNDVTLGEGTYKQRIRKLLDAGLTSIGVATAIVVLKKAAKKSWTSLGVTDREVEQIMKLYDRK